MHTSSCVRLRPRNYINTLGCIHMPYTTTTHATTYTCVLRWRVQELQKKIFIDMEIRDVTNRPRKFTCSKLAPNADTMAYAEQSQISHTDSLLVSEHLTRSSQSESPNQYRIPLFISYKLCKFISNNNNYYTHIISLARRPERIQKAEQLPAC